MLYHLLVATIAITGLTGVWMGVQALARRRSRGGADEDVLACSLCGPGGLCSCGLRKDDERLLRGTSGVASAGKQEVQS